jgi:hypothetical protein
MTYIIEGFGENTPYSKGVEIARSNDRGYAIEIAIAMAKAYPGQIFGLTNIKDGERHMWKQPKIEEVV